MFFLEEGDLIPWERDKRTGIRDLFTLENLSGTFHVTLALLSPHSAALVQTVPALVLQKRPQ